MMPRKRFVFVLLIVAIVAAFCSARVYSQDHAKPREGGKSQAQSEKRRGGGPPPEARQPRAGRAQPQRGGERDQEGARSRGDAERRRPQPGYRPRGDDSRSGRPAPGPSYDAQRRHPQPDGRYGRDFDERYGRYHPRNYPRPYRYDRYRFPRFYFGLRLFDGYRYHGRPFGPHYGLWYRDGFSWRLFYWPYAYPPPFGCGWYWVPRERVLVYDPYTGEEFWDYSDYGYVYICFD